MNDDIKELMEEYGLNADDHEYFGLYDKAGEYAKELLDEVGDLPEDYRGYIDYQKFERDMELNGEITTIELPNGQIHVFQGC